MPGLGKYTNFSDTIPDENNGGTSKRKVDFLRRLYSSGPSMILKDVIERAKNVLKSDVGNLRNAFGDVVDLNYTQAPDLSEVKFKNPGDPATPYTPDVRSPGTVVPVDQLGSTDTTSLQTNLSPRDGDPGVSVSDFVPNYTPGAPGSSTKSPNSTSPKVADGTELGKELGKNNSSPAGSEIYK